MRMPILAGRSRILAAADFVNAVGSGLYFTVSALFLTRAVGLTLAQVGFGLSVAAAAAVLASAPRGRLADSRGPRTVLMITLLVQALASAALVMLYSFSAFVVVAVIAGMALSGARGAQGALIAQLVPADDRVRVRAFMRAAANAGLTIGAAVASLGLVADARPTYVALVLGNAATFVIAAVLVSRLRGTEVSREVVRPSRLTALRDVPFVALTVLDAVMSVQYYL